MPPTSLRRALRLLALGLALAFAHAAAAWGPTGHRVVARLAEARLAPATAKAIEEILGAETLVDASTWADEIRDDPKWKHAGPWHYINVPDGQTYAESAQDPAGDAYTQLVACIETLRGRDASKAERAVAVRWIVHLVADLHQPLHVGRAEDRGGNFIEAEWFGRRANLHRIWDSLLVDSRALPFARLAAYLESEVEVEVERGPKPEPLRWIAESLDLRAAAYRVPGRGARGAYRYIEDNRPIAERRLKQAGIRLVMTLDHALAAPPPATAR